MDNSKKIINTIKGKDIRPTPGWIFTSKKILIWLAFLMAIVFGALAFSVILYTVQASDFDLVSHMGHSGVEMFLGLLPIIWLVFVIAFLGLSILSIRNSWKGYKFSLLKQTGISLAVSLALGTLIFIAGGGKWIENVYDANISAYEGLEERKEKVWSRPDEGYLSGTIIRVNEGGIVILDFEETEWNIGNLQASFIANAVMLEPGEKIKIIGEKSGSNTFVAEEIRPWGGMGRMMGRNRNN